MFPRRLIPYILAFFLGSGAITGGYEVFKAVKPIHKRTTIETIVLFDKAAQNYNFGEVCGYYDLEYLEFSFNECKEGLTFFSVVAGAFPKIVIIKDAIVKYSQVKGIKIAKVKGNFVYENGNKVPVVISLAQVNGEWKVRDFE